MHRQGLPLFRNFNPLPPCGGRLGKSTLLRLLAPFQSTPSVWRETCTAAGLRTADAISIHSLRVEGDHTFPQKSSVKKNFNPLPPCGGRPYHTTNGGICQIFQSTPSVWRETWQGSSRTSCINGFQSTPSVWRETYCREKRYQFFDSFQSTPSVWRETPERSRAAERLGYFNPLPPCGGRLQLNRNVPVPHMISIHSLRVEGDLMVHKGVESISISIHSLRVEGDPVLVPAAVVPCDFNPLPPCGGRLLQLCNGAVYDEFQSTPSVWRETKQQLLTTVAVQFQSTPSVWRETVLQNAQDAAD